MFFEGAEKKVEMVVAKNCPPLTERPTEFWSKVADLCGASIISTVQNREMKAFLLSESSLFVWRERMLMMTCGQTNLVESILFFVKELGMQNIASIIFQRKNEYRSRLQPTDFNEDVAKLKQFTDGISLRFGKLHGHHNLLFHLNKNFNPPKNDTTIEFFMYDISPEFIDLLTKKGLTAGDIRGCFKLENIFEGFSIDDFAFEPYGYSLNAIKNQLYFTIHITPQDSSPYVSFETNIGMDFVIEEILHHLVSTFAPDSFDLISFNNKNNFNLAENYLQVSHTQDRLSNGYCVDFRSFFKENKTPERPVKC